MDPTSNFLSYRSTLRAAVSRSEGATDQRQRVVVPFFSLLIKVGTSSIKFLSEKARSFWVKATKFLFNKTSFFPYQGWLKLFRVLIEKNCLGLKEEKFLLIKLVLTLSRLA